MPTGMLQVALIGGSLQQRQRRWEIWGPWWGFGAPSFARVQGQHVVPQSVGYSLFIASKFNAQAGGFFPAVSPSPSRGTTPSSGCSTLGMQCASWGTSMSSTTAFAGKGAGLQLSWGILDAHGKSTSPNFAPAFPKSITWHLSPQDPPGACPGGVDSELPPSQDIKHLSTFCLLNACSSWSGGHVGGVGVFFLLTRIRRNLLIKEKKKLKKPHKPVCLLHVL
ncbi:protein tyrosine phosphatase type IVA, member 3 [Columba livia]|uniref:Protein tyrosine phosphatase type IVA, member 3 n=1 Tax=Columba livia TaxID=8932 RepID=A0A2I0MXU5_COLLI|nr:protein tyrosine phosphatase type IVA, member 3 [Columba livia]